MHRDIVNPVNRFLLLAAAAVLVGALRCEPAAAETPAAKAPTAAPARGATVAAPPQGSADVKPTAAAGAAEAVPRLTCERNVSVLAGREKDPKALAAPEVKSLAIQAPDLALCGAVASDSDAACKMLGGDVNSPCRMKWSVFHQLRANPKSRSFVYPDTQYEKCKTEMPPAICEKFHDAAVSGDPKKCEGWKIDFPKGKHLPGAENSSPEELLPQFATFCRAMITLDKAECRKLKDANFVKACEEQIGRNDVFAKGLKEMAASLPSPIAVSRRPRSVKRTRARRTRKPPWTSARRPPAHRPTRPQAREGRVRLLRLRARPLRPRPRDLQGPLRRKAEDRTRACTSLGAFTSRAIDRCRS